MGASVVAVRRSDGGASKYEPRRCELRECGAVLVVSDLEHVVRRLVPADSNSSVALVWFPIAVASPGSTDGFVPLNPLHHPRHSVTMAISTEGGLVRDERRGWVVWCR